MDGRGSVCSSKEMIAALKPSSPALRAAAARRVAVIPTHLKARLWNTCSNSWSEFFLAGYGRIDFRGRRDVALLQEVSTLWW